MISRLSPSISAAIDPGPLAGHINRIGPPIATLLLVLVIAWQLAGIAWSLVPAPAAGDRIALPAASATPTPAFSVDVERIVAAHLFGQADAETEAPPPEVVETEVLPETRANLVLKGTVASRQADFSVAVISTGGNDDAVYSIGDDVLAGTALHAIYADRVVLREAAGLTNLRLPSEFKTSPQAGVQRQSNTVRQAGSQDSIQAVVANNMTKLTDVIRPTPYIVDGKPAGYRVYPGRNRNQFAALGLRPGDIIKDIDGQSLLDPNQAMQIFQSLGDAQQVTVTIERNGQSESVVLDTNQLMFDGNATQ